MRFRNEDHFIPGVYNYCDRWCERCRFNNRCRVYASEQMVMAEHLVEGEDPNDPEIVMKDVGRSLGDAMMMLQEMVEEAGIDPEECPPADREEYDPHHHPLCIRSTTWTDRLGNFLIALRKDLPALADEIRGKMIAEFDAGRQVDEETAIEVVTALRDSHELLERYRFFISVKLMRAVSSLKESEIEKDSMLAEFSRSDAMGTAKLVHECLIKVRGALWQLVELRQSWLAQALPLIQEAEEIRQEVDTLFPDHPTFHRAGFDDDPQPTS